MKRDTGRAWIYGINPVMEALKSGRKIRAVYVKKDNNKRLKDLSKLAVTKHIPLRKVDDLFFNRFGNAVHQFVCASVETKKLLTIEQLYERAVKKSEQAVFILLDRIEDPRNLGAVLRVGDGAGVNGVIFQSIGSAGITPVVEKTSSGAADTLPIAAVPNIKQAMRFLKEKDIFLIGAASESKKTLWEADMRVPIAIVLGSEGKGMRVTVRENCDELIKIPLLGKVDSLNVSVAAGVILFECLRQRSM